MLADSQGRRATLGHDGPLHATGAQIPAALEGTQPSRHHVTSKVKAV